MDTQKLVNVAPSVRVIALQFSFSNADFVPKSVRQQGRESAQEQRARENLSTGELVIDPHEDADLIQFVEQVGLNGYELVDAFHQPRDDQHNPRRAFQMVRFVFLRREHVRSTAAFIQTRATLLNEMIEMCEQALWRVRVYLNPLIIDGRRVIGENAVSINLDARKPLFTNGERVAIWRRDEHGQKIGDAKVPIQATHEIHFRDNAIELVPAAAPVAVAK